MDPEELRAGQYYGYDEPPHGYMVLQYQHLEERDIEGGKYVFTVRYPQTAEDIKLSEKQVREMVMEV